jgi:VIT1/CCC1 family predicted Fe2+/Mn2+ transporter
LNWLRAGVLGADDGMVPIAGLVVGVAGASATRSVVLAAGMAGLVAGAVSMALGEYVSVSSQRDSERSLLAQERRELADAPDLELAALYRAKGLSEETAQRVAEELTACCAYSAHADAELGIDPDASPAPGTLRWPLPSPSVSGRCSPWRRSCCHPPPSACRSPSAWSWSPWPSPLS